MVARCVILGDEELVQRQRAPEAQSPNTIRTNQYPVAPNDLINTDGKGRLHGVEREGARHGRAAVPDANGGDGPRAIGIPHGRTFDDAELRHRSALAEPMGTYRQRNVVITDVRLEKVFSLAGPLQASGALDVFNLMNANAEERISWQSGRGCARYRSSRRASHAFPSS